ncbi:MAG: WxL domain-containing protein [Thermomicrobiales bacterium]
MNLKTAFVSVAAAALVTLSATSGAFAASDSAEVSVRVSTPGNATLSAAIDSGSFQEVQYRAGNSFQNSNGSLTVYATDTRGVGSGWTVSLKGSGPFTSAENNTFALDKFSLQSGSVQGISGENVNGIAPQAIGGVSTSAQTIMVAQPKSGTGQFRDLINAVVQVPDGTLVGQYKTTLTVAIVAGQ